MSKVQITYLSLRDVPGKVRDRVGDVVVRHGEDGQLGDGPVAPVNTSGPLVDGGQISIHVTGVTTATGHFLTGSGHLNVVHGTAEGGGG